MGVLNTAVAAALWAAFQAAPVPPPPPQDAPAELDEVVVDGRTLAEQVRDFVDEVAAPARRRGIALWRSRVCFGVVNLEAAQAHGLIDRISWVAADYGVRLAEPGCRPNVVVIFADDGQAMAEAIVAADRRAFHFGVGGLDRGRAALDRFRQSDAPIRWWHVSVPVVGETGETGIRMPGGAPPYVPGEGRVNRGRPITDRMNKVIIIVDAAKVEGIAGEQLADYLAMVSLAQVDPDGDTAGYDSILNLFDASIAPPALTAWDRGYLRALYDSPPELFEGYRQANAVTRILQRQPPENTEPRP